MHFSPSRQRSITDRMIKMMEQYTDNLEELVAERSEQLAIEKDKADKLLCRMLPKWVVARKMPQLITSHHIIWRLILVLILTTRITFNLFW